MMKKRDVVTSTTALNAMLKGIQVPLEGNVLLRSDEYAFPRYFSSFLDTWYHTRHWTFGPILADFLGVVVRLWSSFLII